MSDVEVDNREGEGKSMSQGAEDLTMSDDEVDNREGEGQSMSQGRYISVTRESVYLRVCLKSIFHLNVTKN